MKTYLGILFLLLTSTLHGQAWTKEYQDNLKAEGNALTVLSDGNFAFAGMSAGTFDPDSDLIVGKFSPLGDTIWTKIISYDSTGSFLTLHEEGTSIIESRDGNIIVAAKAHAGIPDYLASVVLKLDQDGNVLQKRHFESISIEEIIETPNKRIVAVGLGYFPFASARSQIAILDADLNMIYGSQHNGSWNETSALTGVCQVNDNAFLACGWEEFSPYTFGHIAMFDSTANIIWSSNLSHFISFKSFLEDIEILDDSSFVVAGKVDWGTQNYSAAIWKLRISDGHEYWRVDGIPSYLTNGRTTFNDIEILQSGNIGVCGLLDTSASWNDAYGLYYELDSDGNILKSATMRDGDQFGFNGMTSLGADLYFTGFAGDLATTDLLIVRNKFIVSETLCGIDTVTFGNYNFDMMSYGQGAVPFSTGVEQKPYPHEEMNVTSWADICAHDSDLGHIIVKQSTFLMFPNPANEILHIEGYSGEIQIYNLQGELVTSSLISNSGQINITDLRAGVYIVKSNDEDKKLIKL